MGMPNTMLREGTIIDATSFADGQKFTVKLTSSRPVADGGTAKIFLARMEPTDEHSSCSLALKWFVNNMADYQQQLLNRELRAVRQVRHPYILPYTGTAVYGFNKILISPYMMNGNLMQYLERKASLDRRPPLLQVVTAVDFLHVDHGMIHGDLKCIRPLENVLVADDGSIRLADFGLSTIIERTETSTRTATALRQQVTVQFAAPELLLGETDGDGGRPVRKTPQTDAYAFGMLVVQAITGRPPWSGCSCAEILVKLHIGATHPRPENSVPPRGLPDSWWDACLSCWTKEPSQRPTMRELLEKLDEPITASPDLLCAAVVHAGVEPISADDEADDEAGSEPVREPEFEQACILRPHTPMTPPWNRLCSQPPTDKKMRRWGLYLRNGVFGVKEEDRRETDGNAGRGGSVDSLILEAPPVLSDRTARRRSNSLPASAFRSIQASVCELDSRAESVSSDDSPRLASPALPSLSVLQRHGMVLRNGSAAPELPRPARRAAPRITRKPKVADLHALSRLRIPVHIGEKRSPHSA